MKRLIAALVVCLVFASGCADVELRLPWAAKKYDPLRTATCGAEFAMVVGLYEAAVRSDRKAVRITDLDLEVFDAIGWNPFVCNPAASQTRIQTPVYPTAPKTTWTYTPPTTTRVSLSPDYWGNLSGDGVNCRKTSFGTYICSG